MAKLERFNNNVVSIGTIIIRQRSTVCMAIFTLNLRFNEPKRPVYKITNAEGYTQ